MGVLEAAVIAGAIATVVMAVVAVAVANFVIQLRTTK